MRSYEIYTSIRSRATSLKTNKGTVANSGVRPDWADPGRPVGGAGLGILRAESCNKVYSCVGTHL